MGDGARRALGPCRARPQSARPGRIRRRQELTPLVGAAVLPVNLGGRALVIRRRLLMDRQDAAGAGFRDGLALGIHHAGEGSTGHAPA